MINPKFMHASDSFFIIMQLILRNCHLYYVIKMEVIDEVEEGIEKYSQLHVQGFCLIGPKGVDKSTSFSILKKKIKIII